MSLEKSDKTPLRDIHNTNLSPMSIKSETKAKSKSKISPRTKNYKDQPTSIKVIAFKLPDEQLEEIDSLIKLGFFHSRSEVYRIAMLELCDYIIDETDDFTNAFILEIATTKMLNDFKNDQCSKSSSCTKMPINMLGLIDFFVDHIKKNDFNNGFLSNRTDFILFALIRFLDRNRTILMPFIFRMMGHQKESD